MQVQDILTFWFEELTLKQHSVKDAALDASMRTRFGRYPRRKAILGRSSNADGLAVLAQSGSSF